MTKSPDQTPQIDASSKTDGPEGGPPPVFSFFNEIGIISQLSSALLNKHLPEGLHNSHFNVLNHLVRLGDGRTPLAIANAFQVSKGTMTHTLAVLEERGFVRLAPNPDYKRSKLVFLTPPGRAFKQKAIASVAPLFGFMAKNIDQQKMLAALPLLQEVRMLLDNNRDLDANSQPDPAQANTKTDD